MEAAIHRRLYEELGLRCPLHFLFKFQYQAQFDETGAENELCSVFIGRSTDSVKINTEEILAWRWVSPEALQAEMAATAPGTLPPGSSSNGTGFGGITAPKCSDLQSELGEAARSR